MLEPNLDPAGGAMPTADVAPPTPQAMFQGALETGNVEQTRLLWQSHPPLQDEFLVQALLFNPSLADFAAIHPLQPTWIQALLANERTARLLGNDDTKAWMEQQGMTGIDWARDQMALMEKTLAQIGNVPGRARDFARSLLGQYPGIAREWFEQQSARAGLLAGLAIGRPQDTWLVDSDIDLPHFLAQVLAHDELGRVVGAGQGEAGAAWVSWIEGQPALAEAWTHLCEDDAELMNQHREWIATWLPDNLWIDSPLQVWIDGEDVEEGRPLDCAPFPEDAEDMDSHQQRALLRKHFPAELFEPLEGKAMAKEARKALQRLIKDAWPEDYWLVLCKRPVGLAIEALARKKEWGWTGPQARQSARVLQASLGDPRLDSVLRKMGENAIARVLDADPKAENWVDAQGRHLLDYWLDAQGPKGKIRAHLVEKLGEGHLKWMVEREDVLLGGRKRSKFDYMGWQAAKERLPSLAQQVKAAVGAKVSQKIREERRRKRANVVVDRTPVFAEPEEDRARKPVDLANVKVAVRKKRVVLENGTVQENGTVTSVGTQGSTSTERSVLRIRR